MITVPGRDEPRSNLRALAWLGALCAAGSQGTTQGATPAAPSAAATPGLRGNAAAGADKAASERCTECHSSDPQRSGPDDGTGAHFPRLTGQDAAYLQKQFLDFRAGRRRHDFMEMMARSVDDADAADIVAWFAALPPMRGDGSGDSEAARRLYGEGDAARAIPACSSCHGTDGVATLAALPRLAGQDSRYLQQQLQAWRSGERRNSADGAMNTIAKALSDDEIQQLAAFLSGR